MAEILPFHADRYDASQVRLEDVLTQPYDKITPEMQYRYYASHPCNLVRLELGKAEAGDSENYNVYTRASRYLEEWRSQGILKRDAEPSIYAYSQRFHHPFAANETAPVEMERRGFIALGKLCDYEEKIIFRHEQTLSKPKADRLNLLRATRAHSGQIFMLYSDPAREIESAIWKIAGECAPTSSLTDEYGVAHRLWKLSEPSLITKVTGLMRDKKLIIADGHHRYETALQYRKERRKQAARPAPNAPYEYLMMTFVNMEGDGPLILPTHRVVFGLPDFDVEKMLTEARLFFQTERLPAHATVRDAIAAIAATNENAAAVAMLTAKETVVLRSIPGAIAEALPHLSPAQRALDVVQLHKILLERALGISEDAIREQRHIHYIRNADEAEERVRNGAHAAFLMNPVRIEQLRELSFAGEVMPQKSTDFYPKLLSGLTIYAVE